MPRDTIANIATLTNITEADLASNRIGKLSDTQKQAMQNKQRRGLALGISFGVLLAGFGLYLLITQSEPDIQLNGIFSLLISAAVFYFTFKPNRISPNDLDVQQVTGYLQKEVIDNKDISHFLIINEVRLQVTKALFSTFSEDDPYTFYYIMRETRDDTKVPTPISFEPATDIPEKSEI